MTKLSDTALREIILNALHEIMKLDCPEFYELHIGKHGPCNMDLAAPNCAKVVKKYEKKLHSYAEAWAEEARIDEIDKWFEIHKPGYGYVTLSLGGVIRRIALNGEDVKPIKARLAELRSRNHIAEREVV